MTLVGLLTVVTLAQPVVRELDVRGEVTREAQVIAANAGFVWFTVGEATSIRPGGARVFRWSRDGGDIVDVVPGTAWSGTDLVFNEFPTSPVDLGGIGRGEALFTLDGEFGAHGRRLLALGESTRRLVQAGSNIVWPSEDGMKLSDAPGRVRTLDASSLSVSPIATTDGRVALIAHRDGGGVHTLIVQPDGGVISTTQGIPVGSAGSVLLFERDQVLWNEAGEALSPLLRVWRQDNGWVSFWDQDAGVGVTDGTPAGTRPLQHLPLALTGTFGLSSTLDGGQVVESFRTGEVTRVAEPFFGDALDDRVIDRNRELFADGGVSRRDVPDCAWRRFEPTSRELFCGFDGGLWLRETPDTAPTLLTTLTPRGRATGTLASVRQPLVRGAPLLLETQARWTDGVVTRTFPNEGLVGQARGQVVFTVDGITLVEPVSGARTALGLPLSWAPFPSLRELFVQRTEGTTCQVRRLNARGTFDDVEPVCLRELIDVPDGLLALSSTLEWLQWEPARRRFTVLNVDNSFQFRDANETWVLLGTFAVASSTQGDFQNVSQNVVLHRKTGRLEPFPEGSRVVLTPQGVLVTTSEGTSLRTPSGAEFRLEPRRFFLPSFTRAGLWLVTDREVLVSTGGAFQVVPADAAAWTSSAAVGSVLFRREATRLVTLSMTGETRSFEFVQANPSFRTGDVRWFALDDGVHGFEPWRFDGESLVLAADLNPGPASSHPHFIGLARGRLIVEAARADGTVGWHSLEFEPLPADPTAPLPEGGCGCSSLEGVCACLLVVALKPGRSRRPL